MVNKNIDEGDLDVRKSIIKSLDRPSNEIHIDPTRSKGQASGFEASSTCTAKADNRRAIPID